MAVGAQAERGDRAENAPAADQALPDDMDVASCTSSCAVGPSNSPEGTRSSTNHTPSSLLMETDMGDIAPGLHDDSPGCSSEDGTGRPTGRKRPKETPSGEEYVHKRKRDGEDEEIVERTELALMERVTSILKGFSTNTNKALEKHLRPREMTLPYTKSELRRIQERDMPRPYRHIKKNIVHESAVDLVDLLKDENDSQCHCVSAAEAENMEKRPVHIGIECGEDCVNRHLHMECTTETCKLASLGLCRNQRLAKRQYKRTSLFKTEGKGWGVNADEDIEPGDLITEMVGEIISDEEGEKRMMKHKLAGDTAFYMVEFGGVTIDAGRAGNEARFVNHSCAPNSQLQKWSVNKSVRIALFAIQKIPKGEEIHYDYCFTSYATPVECRCGAPNCRGVLADVLPPPAPLPVVHRPPMLDERATRLGDAYDFGQTMGLKPESATGSFELFFNGRPSEWERKEGARKHLFRLWDGPLARRPEKGRSVLEIRLEALQLEDPPKHSEAYQALLDQLGDFAPQRPVKSSIRPYRRRGLETCRKMVLHEAGSFPHNKGRSTGKTWHESRLDALDDLVCFVDQLEGGECDSNDLNEDLCSKCGSTGELICCDGCTRAYHLGCLGVYVVSKQPWFCSRCR